MKWHFIFVFKISDAKLTMHATRTVLAVKNPPGLGNSPNRRGWGYFS